MDNYKILICEKCGKEFKVGRKPSDPKQFLNRKYCPDCSNSREFTTRICKSCGKEFKVGRTPDGKHFRNIWKCDSCREPAKYKTLICEKCGKAFEVGKYPGTNSFIKRKLCDECLNYKEKYKTLICQKCGKAFNVDRYDDGHFKVQKYCMECSKPETKLVQCDYCGKWFSVGRVRNPQHGFSLSKYCSDDCALAGFKIKTKQTCQEKYGVDYPCLTKNALQANTGNIISETNIQFARLLDETGIQYDKDKNCNIVEYQIDSYSYDFHVTNTNILIEINPTYTHRTQDNHFGKGKDKNYHYDKTQYARNHGMRCINVWDWDNISAIVNLLKPKNKLYARKLKLLQIDKETADYFINTYHIQGSCYGNIVNLGLFNEDGVLVQVMTFGKPRYNSKYQWELLRLCSHCDYIIIGGAKRLFKYFITSYNPESIISYCDCSKFSGNVYSDLGFKLINKGKPREHWSKGNRQITAALLQQQGYDRLFGTNYGKGTSNKELMLNSGWSTVYDCGQDTYLWVN